MTTNAEQLGAHRVDELTARKLAEFARIEEEFLANFIFVQDVHGQRRFTSFSLEQVVRYLRALYICELKDRLLSVYTNIERYEGERCLRLLRGWQEGQTAAVVAFIHRKLDNLPFGEVSRQIEQSANSGDAQTASRLSEGRVVLLNRNYNLSHALDAIITPEPEQVRAEVIALCARLGHTPADIDRQIADLRSDVYSFAPSAPLARRNMLVMNSLGVRIGNTRGPRPGDHTDRVVRPIIPAPPYAEEVIHGAMTLVSLTWIGASRLAANLDAPATPAPETTPASEA
jgi:hypothetical protein